MKKSNWFKKNWDVLTLFSIFPLFIAFAFSMLFLLPFEKMLKLTIVFQVLMIIVYISLAVFTMISIYRFYKIKELRKSISRWIIFILSIVVVVGVFMLASSLSGIVS